VRVESRPTIVWLHRDLRLVDQPALLAAGRRGTPIVPVYIDCPQAEGDWPLGAASRWWLHHSLSCLDLSLKKRGLRLVLRRGPAAEVLADLVRQTNASHVAFCRRGEPAARSCEQAVLSRLAELGVRPIVCAGNWLVEPGTLVTPGGQPYRVFTPFYKAWRSRVPGEPPRGEPGWIAPPAWPDSERLEEWRLLPQPDWAGGLRATWTPGEEGAQRRLEVFLAQRVDGYAVSRDLMGLDGTSQLAPHLHFGEISVRQVWHALQALPLPHDRQARLAAAKSREAFGRQLAWREFAAHLLWWFPQTDRAPLQPAFSQFPWRDDPGALAAWQRGRTGYPLVDAAMRQLWRTGWMHNRGRMVVGSFLVKHLRLHWQTGAQWFWDTLVDADLANNTLGWQWVAGCGADAAPYFRIFNPVLQGEKFDREGRYVRRWVPELARLPDRWIHRPLEAPPEVLAAAGVVLGKDYPRPIVDHAQARREALAALAAMREARHGG
jgi:deoxyribodipyrimidine photo-lyase